jgi:tetratricopeptide (TPR) repeat protein
MKPVSNVVRWAIRCAVLWLTAAAVLPAQEPYQEFTRALRDRNHHDMALYYLDLLATRPGVPDDVRQVIPYEKAITLLESSRITRSPERQLEQLDQALAFLEQFVKDTPNHPQAADANSERAQILIGKARVEILQAKSPANQGAKGDFLKRARDYIAKARAVFKTAYEQHETTWKRFGTFIDKTKDADKYEARAQSEVNMIRAQLDLALCTYEEAQTYDAGSADYKRLLNDAAAQFEEMHQRYRSQVGGLYARLWQGKCFEEQGDLQKALGIYNELLAHPGDEGAIKRLKDQTLQFKLISLNSKQRSDHQLVADLGEEWIKFNKAELRTRTGLGIQWEVARAFEMLGDQRELPKADAQRFWREAKDRAQQVNRFPGEFHDVSLALMQRLDVKLGGKERQPDTFDAAFGLGRQMITSIKELMETIDGAGRSKLPKAEVDKLKKDFDAQLRDAAKTFDLALRLATPQDDAKSFTTARYMYAYVNFLMRKNYEAAILGEYVAKTASKDDSDIGLNAAYLSMAAFVQAFNDTKGDFEDKQADIGFIVHACNLLTDRWPDSDSANEARMTLGRIYSQLKQPVEAAEWYGKVPETDPKFPEAQLAAGQAYWTAYLTAARPGEEDQITPEQLIDWRKKGEQFLRSGIAKLSATAPKDAAPPELIAAKMSLAQIVLSLGQDTEAIKLLLDDPQSVIKAITIADETKRPEKGVQSRQFATETYKLLLRAYIGVGKLDDARTTMRTLEKVAGGEAGADVTDLYVGLGKLLRDELDRFREAGETDKFNKLMTSFETFLNDLYQRKDGQTFGSLSWIGETYFALGEASTNDAARSVTYFTKAGNAFNDILKLAAAQPDVVQGDQLSAVKVRLVRCYRLKKEFETGEQLVGEILKQKDKDLRAQVEAAYLYQDWGSSGSTTTADKLLMAIGGNSQLLVWGWGNLGNRLQNSIVQGKSEFLPTFVEARVNGTLCRYRYAQTLTSLEKRMAELEKCEIELVATVSVIKGLTDEQLKEFNDLYRKVLQDSGKPVVDLQPTQEIDPTTFADTEKPAATQKKAGKPPETVKAAPISSTGPLIGLGVVVLLGAGIVGWMVMKNKQPHHSAVKAESKVSFGGINVAVPVAAAGPPVGIDLPPAAPRPKPKAAPAAGLTAASATAAPTARPAAKPTTAPAARPAAPVAPVAKPPAAPGEKPAAAAKPPATAKPVSKPKPKPPEQP